MYPLFKRSTIQSKHLFAFSAILLSVVLIAAIAIMSGAASASPELPAGNGSYAPLPPPTVPPTVGSRTPTPGPGTPTAIVSTATPGFGSPTVVTSPTVPGPQPSAEPTWASCPMSFTDVLPGAWFYNYIHWLYCQGVVQGYPDGTFRPGNQTTRGQIVKIVSGAFLLPTHTDGGPHFTDVPADQTFYSYIETAYYFGLVTGYPCGGVGEPCDSESRPYFRPSTNVTRGQLSKVIVLTAQLYDPVGWVLLDPPVATFNDVQVGSTFYGFVETAVAHGVVDGYPCGAANEPCPGRYFRPNGNSTRAQLAKMVFMAVGPSGR